MSPAQLPHPATPQARPRRRWFRRWVRLGVLLLVITFATGWWATRPTQLTRFVTAAVESSTGLDATIESANLSLNGVLTLRGVSVRIPGQPDGGDRLFDADHVVVESALSQLSLGRLDLRSIVLLQPTLYLTEEPARGTFNLHHLPRRSDGATRLPTRVPEVFVRGGVIRFGELEHAEYAVLGELPIEGTLTDSLRDPGNYSFVLRHDEGGDPGQPVVRGTLRLRDLKTSAVLQNFSIDTPQRNFLPRRVRDWWDRLDPQGVIPRVEITFDTAGDAATLRATLEITDGGVTLPYGGFATRMSDVSGRFILNDDQVRIDTLRGLIEGVRYTIDGTIDGFEADAAFDLAASTEPFTLEENPAFLKMLPPDIREDYDRFTPSGTFALQVQTTRPARGGSLQYGGKLDVLDARGAYRKFPFPLHNVRGEVRFNDQAVEVVGLTGVGPTGGRVTVAGRIAPPGDGAMVDVTVTADQVPVDEALLSVMEPRHRRIVETFVSTARYTELLARGVIRRPGDADQAADQGPADDPADASAPPTFALGGPVSASVRIFRPFGDDSEYEVTTTIDTAGVGLLLSHWPYPMVSEHGTVMVGDHEVIVTDIHARGLTGARASVSGRVDRPARDQIVPDIRLTDVHMPVDEVLLASLPSPQDQWVRRLGLTGALVGSGEVFEREDSEIDFRLVGSLEDADATPLGDDNRLEEFTGSFTLSRDSLTLDRLTGRTGDTSLVMAGTLDWSTVSDEDHAAFTTDLRLSGVGLRLGPHLLDLVPDGHPARERVGALFERHQPVGRFDAELDYRAAPGGRGEFFTVTAQPHALAFDYEGTRIAFEPITGVVVIRPNVLELDNLRAGFASGSVALAGRVPLGDEGRPALRISAEGAGIDDTLRALMPRGVIAAIDGMDLRGGYRMTATLIDRATAPPRDAGAAADTPRATPPASELVFDALVTLSNAAADVGVPVTELDGVLEINAVKRADALWPRLNLRLDAERLRIAERVVSPLDLRLVSGDRPEVLRLGEMLGSVYGGTLVGKGSILLGSPGAYEFDFTLQDVAVEPFLSPRQIGDARANGALPSGRLSASLAIEGVPGNARSRSGRGAIEARDAAIFRRPLAMAVLQAANLALPTQGSFDRASARFLLDGDTVRFDALKLESPTVAIIGTGTLDYPTQRLDLNLVTRNPGAPNLGPLGEMFQFLKDELIAIHVTGPIDEPTARLVSFETIRSSVAQVLGTAEPAPTATAPTDPQR